jgi:hypothetical protein
MKIKGDPGAAFDFHASLSCYLQGPHWVSNSVHASLQGMLQRRMVMTPPST